VKSPTRGNEIGDPSVEQVAMTRLYTLLSVLLPLTSVAAQNSVSLERLASGTWRATYHLSAPATALRFERPASFFRERIWTVVTPGYQFGRDGDAQVVRVAAGATPQRDIVFEFPEYTATLPKEYELFLPFTGGAVAVFTGHFRATPIVNDAGGETLRAIDVTPPDGMKAVVRGRVVTGRVTFSDSIGEGTYIYLGNTTPIETPDVVAIVDPGMPPWLVTLFNENLPRLFAAYRERFGYPLPWKPVVLFSFGDAASPGLSSGGGTLTGLVNMTFTGGDWLQQTPARTEQAVALIAHESAHLWNGHLAENVDQAAGSWMHEGSADALATEMLYALGVIDSARYRARREEAINQCATAMASGSVATAGSRNAIREIYDCGFVLTMWTAAAAHGANSTANAFTFWHDLIASAAANKGSYDQARYFAVLEREHVPDSVIAGMKAFVATRDGMRTALDGLRAAGVPVDEGSGVPPLGVRQQAARLAMAHLMSQACGRINFNSGPSIRTSAVAGCEPFATEHVVFAVDGHRVRDDGAALYDTVRAACAAARGVSLQGDDGSTIVTVPCRRPLAPRPAWYVLK
jgi:hypothetical protein